MPTSHDRSAELELEQAKKDLLRAQHTIADLKAGLLKRAEETEHARRDAAEFIAKTSQEIRTPLNGIVGFTDQLLERDLGRDDKAKLDLMRECGTSVLQIMSDISDRSEIEADDSPRRQAKLRVLIAEDNRINQFLVQSMIEHGGHAVTLVDNGLDVVEAARRETFDLVLMDIRMPRLGGLEATKRIRALEGPAGEVPVIAVTANAKAGNWETYRSAGFNDFVAKPIRLGELGRAVRDLTGVSLSVSRTTQTVMRNRDLALSEWGANVAQSLCNRLAAIRSSAELAGQVYPAPRAAELLEVIVGAIDRIENWVRDSLLDNEGGQPVSDWVMNRLAV
jgi:CheY-like chemotaxis protein